MSQALNGIPGSDFFYDQQAQFSMAQVQVAPSAYSVTGNLCTVTTAAHSFGALFTTFTSTLGQTPDSPLDQLPLMGVVIAGVTNPSIMNSTWIIHSVPLTTSFTFNMTSAQTAQMTGGASMAGATVSLFITLGTGLWDLALGANTTLQQLLAGGMPGGANTTVSSVIGGSVLPFHPQYGGATYTTVATGASTKVSRLQPSDGRSVQLLFGASAGTTLATKYR